MDQALQEMKLLNIWKERFARDVSHIKILLDAEESEAVIDLLEKHIARLEDHRIIILPVEAAIPRPPEPEEEPVAEIDADQPEKKPETRTPRISREELYADINETIKLSKIYIVMVILSSIVAAIGIIQNNIAVIIGAMVIAPLLGPNVAMSLATTLADVDLTRRAVKTNVVGILTALALAAAIGYTLNVDPNIPEILSRTKVELGDVVLALAAGSAAALSFTTGLPGALIGVMVAVALLPPLVVFGILLGTGNWELAYGALLLLLTNLISINLAGVMTFLAQGIRPRKYWDADRAKAATKLAITTWTILLLILVAAILLSRG